MSALSRLDVAYSHADLTTLLAQDDVLAVLGFGDTAPALADPRYLRVGLLSGGAPAAFEVWRASAPLQSGVEGLLRWSANADYLFVAIEVDEAANGGIQAASELAYRNLIEFVARQPCPHLLRIWNYLAHINQGSGDEERYRLFCTGRASGMLGVAPAVYPAASAIGRSDGVHTLQLYCLAARMPGRSVENPRQVSAWRYPREYGPTAPIFARAMLSPTEPPQLHISGTAAVVGHASLHGGDLAAQMDETFANLESLYASAGRRCEFDQSSVIKAYVRHPEHLAAVTAQLCARLPDEAARVVLLGDICRSELLVELDGVHGSSRLTRD